MEAGDADVRGGAGQRAESLRLGGFGELDREPGEDAVGEGWIVRRGRSTVFCRAEVQTESGGVAATGDLVYTVRPNGGR